MGLVRTLILVLIFILILELIFILIRVLIFVLILIVVLVFVLVLVLVLVPILILMLPEHARSALLKHFKQWGRFAYAEPERGSKTPPYITAQF